MMLATFFCSASGGGLSKKSPSVCSTDCLVQIEDGEDVDVLNCYYMHFGRLVAIGVVSAVVAGVPIAMLSGMHQREFVHVSYEGSPDWHRQLRRWRRADASLSVLGILYCLFAVNYVCLFFANVASKDQESWMISAGIGFLQDFVIIPVGFGLAVSLMALVTITCISWKYGLARSHITQHGSVEHLREVLRTRDKGAIQRALTDTDVLRENLTDSYDDESWNRHFDLGSLYDVGHAHLEHLQPRSVG